MLLLAEGFEGWSIGDIGVMYPLSTVGAFSIAASGGRRGGGALYRANNATAVSYLRWSNLSTDDELYMGVAVKFGSISYSRKPQFLIWGTGTGNNGFWEYESATNHICWYSTYGVGSVLRGTSGAVDRNTWYFVETYIKVHGSNGAMEGRINGNVIFSSSGYATNGGSGTTTIQVILAGAQYAENWWDDFYVLDTAGSKNISFLGDCRVDPIFVSGAGTYAQMTPSAGSNYECVDDTDFNSSDYVEGDSDGEMDSYSFDSVPTELADGKIKGLVTVFPSKRTESNDLAKVRSLIRTGGTDYTEESKSLSETWRFERQVYEVDPSDSNDWTKSKINACEFGVYAAISTTTSTTTTTTT